MRTIIQGIVAAVACTLALAVAPALAQQWPQRTVKFIVPLGPGSGADITARLLGDRLTQRWGQSVVIENRPGGDGIVAITAFIGARDDHTLLFSPSSSFTSHPYLHDKLTYDARELSPIARVTNTLVSIAVPISMKIGSLKELEATARAEPGKLNWASVTGALDLIFAAWLKEAGLNMTRVPYRDLVQAVNDLAEERIQTYNSAFAIAQSQWRAGRIRVIAMTNRERAASAPDVPTVLEAGYPALAFDGLVGLFGPPDMPNAVRDRIAADIRTIVTEPQVTERLVATGQQVNPGTASEFAKAIEEQRVGLASVARTLGLKAASQ